MVAALVVGLALVGCARGRRRAASSTSSSATTSSTASAGSTTATTATPPGSPGSATAPLVGGPGRIRSGGLVRTYLLHVPPHPASPLALVVNLHGGGGTAAGQERITGYDRVADEHGFLVVYPQGIDKNWADGRGVDEPDRRHVDDVAFLSALIDQLVRTHGVDPNHVYATGLSNGAFMSQRLACDLAPRIAAVAPVAGTLGMDVPCTPSAPVSVFEVHGLADPLVPYTGGVMIGRGGRSTIVAAPAMVARWRALDRCTDSPTVRTLPDDGDGTRVVESSTTRCADGAAVVFVTVRGGGHTWPGGEQYLPVRLIGRTTTQLSASEASWAFFAAHPRR